MNNRATYSIVFFTQISLSCGLLLASISVYATTVIAASILPVSEYTRITIETDQAVTHSIIILKNPDRVVLDLKNIQINNQLKALTTKVLPVNSYIKKVRVAKFQQGVARIVVDLKAQTKHNITAYQPAGEYQHRLALDIYPKQDVTMTQEETNKTSSEAPTDDIVDEASIGDSKSSGAKIILESGPIFEPEAGSDALANPE